MNKRADWTILNTMTIIAGIIVAVTLVIIVYKVTSKDAAQSAFYAKDSALLADAILAAPQEVQLVYPAGFSGKYIRLSNDSFSVFDSVPPADKDSPYKYFFSTKGDIKVIDSQIVMSSLYFLKNSKTFTIASSPVAGTADIVSYEPVSVIDNPVIDNPANK